MQGQVIYGDVLFLINFSMDFLILLSSGRLLHLKARTGRLALAAAIGGVYSVFALFIPGRITGIILNIAFSFVLCFAAYGRQDKMGYVKLGLIFYALSMLLGGCVTSMYSALNRITGGVQINSGFDAEMSDIPLWIFCILALISVAFSVITGRVFRSAKRGQYAVLEVTFGTVTQSFNCLIDTGSSLREPISGLPVAVVDLSRLSLEMKKIFEGIKKAEGCAAPRLIPVNTVSGKTVLYGAVPDSAKVKGRYVDIVVAVQELGKNGPEGLLPGEIR